MGFSGKISSSFLRQSAVVQIVLVNAVVFVIVHIAALFGIGYVGEWLMLPQSWTEVMSTPWTLLTYMFAHFDFLHILGNMLCLYCFGIVALDLMTPRRFVATYIAGGLAGAAAYLFAAEFVPSPGLIGSSAAVMAVAAAARSPCAVGRIFFCGSRAPRPLPPGFRPSEPRARIPPKRRHGLQAMRKPHKTRQSI